jgi:hypothetical protein
MVKSSSWGFSAGSFDLNKSTSVADFMSVSNDTAAAKHVMTPAALSNIMTSGYYTNST